MQQDNGLPLRVPEGRNIVAHHGSGGKTCRPQRLSPGRGDTCCSHIRRWPITSCVLLEHCARSLCRPSGTRQISSARAPTTSVVGYGLSSLRDSWQLIIVPPTGVTCLLPAACGKRCRRGAGVAESWGDPSWRVFIWPGHRKLSECLHSADSRGQVHRAARIELHEMREGDRGVRQYSRPELGFSGRQVPQLQDQDFGDVPGRGIAYRDSVPGLLLCIWADRGRAEVGRFCSAARRTDDHRPSRAHSSRRSEFFRTGRRPALQLLHQVAGWHGAVACEPLV